MGSSWIKIKEVPPNNEKMWEVCPSSGSVDKTSSCPNSQDQLRRAHVRELFRTIWTRHVSGSVKEVVSSVGEFLS